MTKLSLTETERREWIWQEATGIINHQKQRCRQDDGVIGNEERQDGASASQQQ